MDAKSVDFDRAYTIDAECDQRLYRWLGVRPRRHGSLAIFELTPKPIADDFDPKL